MSQKQNKLNMWDRVMMAITFAEAGEPNTALDMLKRKSAEKQKETRLPKQEQRPNLRV